MLVVGLRINCRIVHLQSYRPDFKHLSLRLLFTSMSNEKGNNSNSSTKIMGSADTTGTSASQNDESVNEKIIESKDLSATAWSGDSNVKAPSNSQGSSVDADQVCTASPTRSALPDKARPTSTDSSKVGSYTSLPTGGGGFLSNFTKPVKNIVKKYSGYSRETWDQAQGIPYPYLLCSLLTEDMMRMGNVDCWRNQ